MGSDIPATSPPHPPSVELRVDPWSRGCSESGLRSLGMDPQATCIGGLAFMEYEDKVGRPSRPPSPKRNVRKNLDFEPLSTTALILEDRPVNLPAKLTEEAQKHRQQYEETVVQAKKQELEEAQWRKSSWRKGARLKRALETPSSPGIMRSCLTRKPCGALRRLETCGGRESL